MAKRVKKIIWGKEDETAHSHCTEQLSGTNLEMAFPKVMYKHSAIANKHVAVVVFLFCLRQLYSCRGNSSNPAFHSAPHFLKKSSTAAYIFPCLVSARGELFWHILLKSSQMTLSFGRRGKKEVKWNFRL